jgi:prevent-host-death family protein
MIKANVSTLKNSLSRYLQKVRQGETIEVVDRDLPIARIIPIEASTQRSEEWLMQLDRLGLIRRGNMKGCQEILKEPSPGNLSANVLEALLDERRDGR